MNLFLIYKIYSLQLNLYIFIFVFSPINYVLKINHKMSAEKVNLNFLNKKDHMMIDRPQKLKVSNDNFLFSFQ